MLEGRSKYTGLEGTYLPLGIPASFDRIKQILTKEIRILASSLLRLFPYKTSLALQSLPVELDKLRSPIVSDEAIGVHAEAINMTDRSRNTMSGHRPHKRMQGTGLLTEKVPGRVMCSGSLGNLIIATGLHGVDQVRKKNCILDEEDGNVVADDICPC